MESYLIPRTSSPLNKWLLKTLVNIHAALRTVKERMKQAFTFSLLVTLFIFCSFFLIEVKGGSHLYQREGVLVHNRNKCSIFFSLHFFSLLRSNFHNFFHYCKNEKKRRFSFSESDLRTFKTHKEESLFRIQKLFLVKQWRHLKHEFKVTGRTNISELSENVRSDWSKIYRLLSLLTHR